MVSTAKAPRIKWRDGRAAFFAALDFFVRDDADGFLVAVFRAAAPGGLPERLLGDLPGGLSGLAVFSGAVSGTVSGAAGFCRCLLARGLAVTAGGFSGSEGVDITCSKFLSW
jgi:hypothetical protein